MCEMTLEEARAIRPQYELGDLVEVPVTPKNFGRIAAQTAKQVVVQHLREAERGVIYDEYSQKENEILTAIVQRVENKQRLCGDWRARRACWSPTSRCPPKSSSLNDRIKVYVLEVSRSGRGPQVFVSRTHPGLVKRLFELEVPEIVSGVVQIKTIAREAGFRTKMAVVSTDPLIDAVGSCVGPRGMRVENVVNELKTEKIDIIKWSYDPAEYIANALNPARVIGVLRLRHGEVRARHRAGQPAVAGHRQGRPECPPRRQADRLEDRHQEPEPGRGRDRARGSRGRDRRADRGIIRSHREEEQNAEKAQNSHAHVRGMP